MKPKTFQVEFSKSAKMDLSKMDPFDRKIIISWLGKNLQGCVDPRRHGKSLIGERAEQWRYRVGDYRVIAEIQDEKVLILVLAIGHRRAVYERR